MKLSLISQPSHSTSNHNGKSYITEKMEDYLKLSCKNIDEGKINTFLEKNEKLITHFKNNTHHTITESDKTDYFVAFTWGLMAAAVENDQGFVHGTFTFEDPEHKIVDFFKPVAYRRISSHYKGKRIPLKGVSGCFFSSYAIDHNLFPAGHQTAMFAPIKTLNNKHYSFLKIEEHPFSWRKPLDLIKHSRSYLATRPRVWNLPIFRTHDEHKYREEDAPHHLVSVFKKIINTAPVKKTHYQQALKNTHIHGIAGIWHECEHLLRELQATPNETIKDSPENMKRRWKEVEQAINMLKTEHLNNYSHIDIRKGNEVILHPLYRTPFKT